MYNNLKNKQKDSARLCPYSINGNSMKLAKNPNVKMKMKSTFATEKMTQMNIDSSGQNTVRENERENTEELTDEYHGSQFVKPSFAPFTYPLRKSRRIKLKISKNSMN